MWIDKNRNKLIAIVLLDIAVAVIVLLLFFNLSPFKEVAQKAKLTLLCERKSPEQNVYDSNHQELLALEQHAFQSRQQAFVVAGHFSELREKIKKSPADRKLIAEANDVAMKLHSLSASTREIQKRAQISRAVLESQSLRVGTQNIASSEKNKWCALLHY